MSRLRSQLGVAAIILTSAASVFLFRTISASSAEPPRDFAVTCGPEHRAIVRQISGQASVAVDCVPVGSGAAFAANVALTQSDVAAWQTSSSIAPRVIPAVYSPETDVVRNVRPAPVVRTVATSSGAATAGRIGRKPSWQKRALVVGGTAGAGAGIGALIGGKKGALIGAAVGGGGAAVVDRLKHR